MPSVVPSSVADAKLAEKAAWRRYAEAKDDNWREAFAEWVEARDALLAAYADEAANLHNFDRHSASVEGQTTTHSRGPIAAAAAHRGAMVKARSRSAPGPIASVNIAVSRSRRSVRRCASVRCVAVSPTT